MFDVNDKVVLVDDKWPEIALRLYKSLPVKGPAYVVRAIRFGADLEKLVMDRREEGEPSVLLIGIVNPGNHRGIEHGFAMRRFRKLDQLSHSETATDQRPVRETKPVEATTISSAQPTTTEDWEGGESNYGQEVKEGRL